MGDGVSHNCYKSRYNRYMKKKIKKSSVHHRKPLSHKIGAALLTYAKTQLVLMSVVTVVTWITLSKLGVQFALLLALITGSVSVIPIVGITTAAIIASGVAIFDTIRFLPNTSVLLEGFVVLTMYALLNIVIDYFLSPYLVGKSSGINPYALLFFVLIGTWFFGIWGALLTMPAVLVGRVISEHYNK